MAEFEEISLDNLDGGEDFFIEAPIPLEEENGEGENIDTPPTDPESNEEEEKKIEQPIISEEDLFNDSFGEIEDKKTEDNTGENGTPSSDKDENSNSPTSVFSSIATALKEDGVFLNLGEEDLKIDSADAFNAAIDKEIAYRLTAKQQRIDAAMEAGVDVSYIKNFENILDNLNNVQEEDLMSEGDEGEALRKNLIYNDYINKGFSKEKASRFTEKSVESGSDIEDAKEALEENKKFYDTKYKEILQKASDERAALVKKQQEQSEKLKKDILETEEHFGIKLSKADRAKIYNSIAKPFYTDDNGNKYTEIQKYQMENPVDFQKYVGVLYTMTDGFKNIDKILGDKVNKKTNKKMKEVEHTLNNSNLNLDGSLNFGSGLSLGDNDSYDSFTLDL